jgi:hypothetical protein
MDMIWRIQWKKESLFELRAGRPKTGTAAKKNRRPQKQHPGQAGRLCFAPPRTAGRGGPAWAGGARPKPTRTRTDTPLPCLIMATSMRYGPRYQKNPPRGVAAVLTACRTSALRCAIDRGRYRALALALARIPRASDELRATSAEGRAPSDERRATSAERRAPPMACWSSRSAPAR